MDNATTSNPTPQPHALTAAGVTAAAPTVATPTLHTRVVPDEWVSLDAALAWVAFGDAVDLSGWDQRFYVGASLWIEYAPRVFFADLRAIADGPDQAYDGFVSRVVAGEARRLFPPASPPSLCGMVAGNVPAAHRAAAARKLLADTGDEGRAAQTHEAVWRASKDLRRAIASGAIKAFGRRGADDPERMGFINIARERIPPDVCAGPVTLGQGGIWPFPLGDYALTFSDANQLTASEMKIFGYQGLLGGLLGESVDKLWCEILVDAPELLRAFPAPDDGAPTAPYRLAPAEKPARRGGGRREIHDWKPFQDELIRRLTLDGVELGLTDLRKRMKDWAGPNMPTAPDGRTIEKKIAEVLPAGLFPD